MNSPGEHGRALLARARDDLFVVRRLAKDPDAPGWVIGFHTQQAVEKALKAVLAHRGIAYPRTHNLMMLLEMLRASGCSLPADAEKLAPLVPFGVVFRYEEFADDDLRVDAEDLNAVATRTIDWAAEHLAVD